MEIVAHVGPDGERYVDRANAAKLMGVAPHTIDTWVSRGHLKPLPGCPPRKQLYKLEDVQNAELKAYQAAVRTSGSDKRVKRDLVA